MTLIWLFGSNQLTRTSPTAILTTPWILLQLDHHQSSTLTQWLPHFSPRKNSMLKSQLYSLQLMMLQNVKEIQNVKENRRCFQDNPHFYSALTPQIVVCFVTYYWADAIYYVAMDHNQKWLLHTTSVKKWEKVHISDCVAKMGDIVERIEIHFLLHRGWM